MEKDKETTKHIFSFDPNQGFLEVDPSAIPPPLTEEIPPKPDEQPPPIDESTPKEEEIPVNLEKPLEEEKIEKTSQEESASEGGVNEKNIDEPLELQDTDDNQGEGQEDDEESITEEETFVTDNFYIAAMQTMKERGELPEEFELDDNLDEGQAAAKIYEGFYETQKSDVYKELFNEFQNEVKKRGWTEQTLEYAAMLENGIQPNEIAKVVDYNTLASVDIEKLSDNEKQNYIRKMYEDREWKVDEINRAISSADIDGELDKLASEGKEYFGGRRDQEVQEKKNIAEQNNKVREQQAQQKQAIIASIFNEKKIADEEFTEEQLDEFEEAIYERSVPISYEGQTYNLSPFEQFQYQVKNDFGMQLYLFKKWMFRESDKKKIEMAATKKAEEKQVIKWGKKVKEMNKTKDASDTTKKTSPSNREYESYILDGGDFKPI